MLILLPLTFLHGRHQAGRHDQIYARELWPTPVSKYIQEEKLSKDSFFWKGKEERKICCEAELCSHPPATYVCISLHHVR